MIIVTLTAPHYPSSGISSSRALDAAHACIERVPSVARLLEVIEEVHQVVDEREYIIERVEGNH